jgi:hypothetical protein
MYQPKAGLVVTISLNFLDKYSYYIGNYMVPDTDLLVKSGTQPTAVAPHPRPRPCYKVDMSFLTHTSTKGWNQIIIYLPAQYQASSGHYIGNSSIVTPETYLVK